MAIQFFDPNDPLDINTMLELTDDKVWEMQTTSATNTKGRASGLDRKGDEAAFREHNPRSALNITYKCYATSGLLTLPSVGEIVNGYHIDSWTLVYSPTDFPVLTITTHKHTASTGSHADGSCRTYTATVKLPAQYCIPIQLMFEDGKTKAFDLKNPGIGMRSLSFELTCTHVDETGGCGDWLAGENHDGVETLTAEFTGVPQIPADLAIDASWSNPSESVSEGNTQVNTRSLTLVKHIKHDGTPQEP